jgi:hypothetical protein
LLQGSAFGNVPYTTEQMQRYIKYARSIKPELGQDAAQRLVGCPLRTVQLPCAGFKVHHDV